MDKPPSLTQGRRCIVLAALLWSTSGVFTRILTQETFLNLHSPELDSLAIGNIPVPIQIVFFRALFAGLVFLPTLRRGDVSFRGLMATMALFFTVMNGLFITALALGTAANAIFLQYTAPMWMYLASIFLLGEKADRRSSTALMVGMVGIALIVAGGWQEGNLAIIAFALASGIAYAGVVICLRLLRNLSSSWLTVWNHLWTAFILLPLVLFLTPPTREQLLVLFLYGGVQTALPYWLMARGLRSVSPQEAGAITLLEPILNPIWTYLVSGEIPHPATFLGGAFILGGLAWRYWPVKSEKRGE